MFQYHKQLRSFYAVARQGGFTAAARYLHVGQPTITGQVRQLETRFGVELFLRQGKSVTLSPAGEQLFAVAKGMFGHEEEAMQLLQALPAQQGTLLRLGAVSPPIAVDLLAQMAAAHPEMQTSLTVANESETVALLREFSVDVGLLARVPEDAGLHSMRYRSQPIVAVLHREHPLADKASISLRELAAQALVLREPNSKTRQIVQAAAEARGLKLQPRMEINSREAILHAVRAGMGCSFVTDVEFFDHAELRAVPLERGKLRIDYFLCCLATRMERPHIAALLAQAQVPPKAASRPRGNRP